MHVLFGNVPVVGIEYLVPSTWYREKISGYMRAKRFCRLQLIGRTS